MTMVGPAAGSPSVITTLGRSWSRGDHLKPQVNEVAPADDFFHHRPFFPTRAGDGDETAGNRHNLVPAYAINCGQPPVTDPCPPGSHTPERASQSAEANGCRSWLVRDVRTEPLRLRTRLRRQLRLRSFPAYRADLVSKAGEYGTATCVRRRHVRRKYPEYGLHLVVFNANQETGVAGARGGTGRADLGKAMLGDDQRVGQRGRVFRPGQWRLRASLVPS